MQHLADSQLDTLPGYTENDYTSSGEAWIPNHAKSIHFAHDGPGHNSRHHGVLLGSEALKQKVRFQQRGAPLTTDKDRESGDSDETREKRKNEKREIEADEGVGEAEVEMKESFEQMGHCGKIQNPNFTLNTMSDYYKWPERILI